MPTKRHNKHRRHGRRAAAAFTPQPLANIVRETGDLIETKNYYTGGTNVQLYHNGSNGTTIGTYIPVIRPLDGMSNGIADGYRIGNSIRAKQIRIRLWLSAKQDRSNVLFRVVAGVNPVPSTPGTVAVFLNKAPAGEYITAMPDPSVTYTLYDKMVNPVMGMCTIYPSVNVLKEHSFFHEFTIDYQHAVQYVTGGGSTTQNYTLVVFPVAYDAYGSLATDNIASYSYTTVVEYEDA